MSQAAVITAQNDVHSHLKHRNRAHSTLETSQRKKLQSLVEFCSAWILTHLLEACKLRKAEYINIKDRYASFSTWGYGTIQDPMQLASAGFYYTGKEDEVRCFACNGGLCNWERTDIPWYEHAHWYGTCPYVQECRKHPVVAAIIDTASTIIESRKKSSHHHNHTHSQSGHTQCDSSSNNTTSLPAITAAKSSQEKISQNLTGEISSHELLFSDVKHQSASQEKISQNLTGDVTSHGLFSSDAKHQSSSQEVISQNLKDLSLEEENESMKAKFTCKVCLDGKVGVVFLPCSHLVCCLDCGLQLDRCPICRSLVKATTAVHL